jgi:hypothetical protein
MIPDPTRKGWRQPRSRPCPCLCVPTGKVARSPGCPLGGTPDSHRLGAVSGHAGPGFPRCVVGAASAYPPRRIDPSRFTHGADPGWQRTRDPHDRPGCNCEHRAPRGGRHWQRPGRHFDRPRDIVGYRRGGAGHTDRDNPGSPRHSGRDDRAAATGPAGDDVARRPADQRQSIVYSKVASGADCASVAATDCEPAIDCSASRTANIDDPRSDHSGISDDVNSSDTSDDTGGHARDERLLT